MTRRSLSRRSPRGWLVAALLLLAAPCVAAAQDGQDLHANQDLHAGQALEAAQRAFVVGVASAFALLHLLIFAFRPRERANLLYALLTSAIAVYYLASLRETLTADPAVIARWTQWKDTCSVFMPLLGVLVGFAGARMKIPRYFAVGPVATAVALGLIWLRPGTSFWIPLIVLFALIAVSMSHVMWELRRKIPGAHWAAGVALLLVLVMSTAGYLFGPEKGFLVLSLGMLAILTAMSVGLAGIVARTQTDLEQRLVEVEELTARTVEQEAENRRQTEELEAARRLQLSMLPAAPPALPELDVAFEMWTAAEVGGDYYDYKLDSGGRLLLALGDATGHGLDAGLMVVAAKGMFQTDDGTWELGEHLARLSRGIRGLGLRRMLMSMLLLRAEGRTLRFAAAGMPPPLHHRAKDGAVEEVAVHGTPLGALVGFEYREAEITLAPGDAVLLTSDGLPELVDPGGELLGYERTRELFAEAAASGSSAAEMVRELLAAAERFSAGRLRDDDLTLVALRAN